MAEFVTSEKHLLELPFQNVNSIQLKKAFESGVKNIIMYSDCPSFATACAMNYCIKENSRFSKIIYACFDRRKLLYTNQMKYHSIDAVLKACLCRPFVVDDCNKKECHAENYLARFENEADENTLVVIDGFDIAAPSPYMRHLFGLSCTVLVITDKNMENLPDGVLLIKENLSQSTPCNLDVLNDRQKELLMTLCAFLEHLDDSTPIVSSRSGVFDKESVEFYLGSLSDELCALEQYGFVTTLDSGRIYIDKSVRRYILDKLCPTLENCKVFEKFVSKLCDFRILQNVKDISAQLLSAEENYNPFVATPEFMSAYTHFSMNDKDRGIRVYNILISYILNNLSMQNGASYTWHLLSENVPYYISMLCESLLTTDAAREIYNEELYMDELLPDIYTCRIKANLDIIRVCLSFLRNTTLDVHNMWESVFEGLHKAMNEIFDFVKKCFFDEEEKAALLDDCIRLCSESFDYFCAVDKDGIYYHNHDSFDKRRLFYNCEMESDRLHADSIPFGYSEMTLKLYQLYGKFLSEWLMLSRKTEPCHYNNLLKQIHEEKLCDRSKTLEEIKAHFKRLSLGYDSFTDIYDGDVFDIENMQISEKRLQDNKRFLLRGFDGNTKKGAEGYTDSIIAVIKESKCPLRTALTILSPDYPISDESYRLLVKKNFAFYLSKNKNMPNLSLQLLLETLVCDYDNCHDRDGQKELYEEMLVYISERISVTEAFLERMYHAVSSMYVSVKKRELSTSERMSCDGFCDRLYEKYCAESNFKPKYCDDYIGRYLYERFKGIKTTVDESFLINAIDIHAHENGDCDVSLLVSILVNPAV
ncbi:MAG: hypothetical protein IJW06_05545 [Clostridia bacterium]|nr:hypothetical protein [Clostridia bacterium]